MFSGRIQKRISTVLVRIIHFRKIQTVISLLPDDETLQLSKSRNKTAVWYYSVKDVASNRFSFGEKLKNYIDIDVYGKGQLLTCNPYPARCVENVGKIYKFYLAFENALCEDYFTEKAFRAIEENLVPVIYSGANISNFLPPKSYIDANSFETVKDLGNYLKFLSENENEYLKYFWWKKHYEIRQRWLDLCEVCEALNDIKTKDLRKSVESVNKFYILDKCTVPKIKF